MDNMQCFFTHTINSDFVLILLFFIVDSKLTLSTGLEINLDIIPVIMTGEPLNLPVTVEFMSVIVTP
jgi:hypothetical protein